MSFSREVKDFLGGFQSGWKMMGDAELDAAKANYYNSLSEGEDGDHNNWGYGDPEPEQKNWFQKLFSSSDAPPGGVDDNLSIDERNAKSNLMSIQRALDANDPESAAKIEKKMVLQNEMKKRYPQRFSGGGPVKKVVPTAIPDTAATEEPTVEDFVPEEMRNRIIDDMAENAIPGIKMGLDDIERKLQQAGGAVGSDGSETAQMYARGDNAVTPQEFDAMMKRIDPENKLPPEARLAAAIRYATNYYVEKNEPEKAAAIANKLLMFSKNSSQIRGQLAVQAMNNGDVKNAAKLLSDGNNIDLPFSDLIKPAVAQNGDVIVNPDGSVPVSIIRGGQTEAEVNATPDMIMQVAQQTATGVSWQQRVNEAVSRIKAAEAAKKGAGTAKPSDLNAALNGVKAAADAVRAIPEDASEEQRAAAMKQLADAEAKARSIPLSGKNPDWARATREKNISEAKGTIPGQGQGQRPASSGGSGTAEERKAAISEAELNRLEKEIRTAKITDLALGDPSAIRSEGAREEITRRKDITQGRIAEREAQKSAIGYDRSKTREGYTSDDFESRIEPYAKSLDKVLNEGYLEKESGKRDPRDRITMEDAEKRNFLDLVDRVAAKNNGRPETVVRTLLGMAKQINGPKPQVDPRGTVVYQGVRLNIDGNDLLDLARMRGAAVKGARAAISDDYNEKSFADSRSKFEALEATNRFGPVPDEAREPANEMLSRLNQDIARREAAITPDIPERARQNMEAMIKQLKKQRDILNARLSTQAIPTR